MANVPYSPVPSVAAEGVPARSHDYEEIRAFPDAFGANIGRSVEQLGGQIEQSSKQLLQAGLARAQLTNELWANDANTRAMTQYTDLYSDYSKLEGQAAVAARPKFISDLEGVYRSTINSAPNLQAQAMLARSLRYMTDAYGRYATNYADQQWRTWQDRSAKDAAENYANQVGLAVNNPDDFNKFLFLGGDQVRKLAEQHGMGKDEQDAEVAKYNGSVLTKIIGDVAKGGDVGRAEAIYAAYKDKMDAAGRYSATTMLKPYLAAEKGGSIVDQAMSDRATAQPGVRDQTIDGLVSAIRAQEGGPPENVFQIQPQTWMRYAKPGEDIRNPQDNETVARRIITDLYDKNGGDPSRVAVGFFSGAGNISPLASASPWKADAQDKNGKSTSSYVSDIMRRLGQPGAPQKSDLIDRVEQATRGQPPEVRSAAFAELDRRLKVQDAAYQDQERAVRLHNEQVKATSDQQEMQYRKDILGPNPSGISAQQIVADPKLDREAQDRLISLISGSGKAADRLSHSTLVDLINRMSLPEGDPNRVSDLTPIDKAFGKDTLNKSDYEFAVKRFNEQRTPDGDVLSKRRAEFIKGVAPLIDKSNPLMGSIDPSGPQQMYLLNWDIDQKIAAYRKAGKDPFDLFDPSKPDYLGRPDALRPYQKPLQQSLQDRAAALTGQPTTPTPQQNTVEGSVIGKIIPLPPGRPRTPPRNEGESADEYLKRIGMQ